MSDDDQEDGLNLDIFEEPTDFRQPEKPHTFQTIKLEDGGEVHLRLVGSNPLWGHYLWNGARAVSRYLLDHIPDLVRGKHVLELGAGAGLPSLVCASHGARAVVVTDYPDADLIENLTYNINKCELLPLRKNIVAKGYLWGAPPSGLKSDLEVDAEREESRFDVVILADLLFNHSEHRKLMDTVKLTLARTAEARALVFFTPYRPWLLQMDLAFFDLAAAVDSTTEQHLRSSDSTQSIIVRKLSEEVMEKVMFEEDRGDELLRRTVFGYEMMWADLQQ